MIIEIRKTLKIKIRFFCYLTKLMNFNEKKNCVKSQGIGVSLDQSYDMHHERFTNLCTYFTYFYRRDFTNLICH